MVRTITQRGYTLVELMIAMIILMGLILSANYSYALYSKYWHGRLGTFDQQLFYYQSLLQVKETIDSAIPYFVGDKTAEYHTFYFLGRAEGFTLVTAAPIFAPTINDAAVVRIFSERHDDGYQLVYEEAPLVDKLLLELDQTLDFKYRTVLMELNQPVRFSYLGWDHFDQKAASGKGGPKPSWRAQYDAAQTRIQPERITMTMDQRKLEFVLPVGNISKRAAFEIGREMR